jgi:hypothetical protein
MKKCFSIMPFGDSFKDIDRIISKAVREVNFDYVRGDLSKRPGSILAQIIQEIKHSDIVIADITGNNPNVFYELGIAHQILGPDQVILITQSINEKQPYDIHQFRQLVYANNKEGRAKLKADLPKRIEEAAAAISNHENWKIIRGKLPRTKMIVNDLKKVISQAGEKGLEGFTIRIIASLGSMAISNYEPPDNKLDNEYLDSLLQERDTLKEALLKGAKLKSIINPPRRFAKALTPLHLSKRYERLIGLLQGKSDILNDQKAACDDTEAIKNCEFVLSPVPMTNQFIIGNIIAYEGMKRGGMGGFEMTHWETDKKELNQLCEQFERLFEESRQDMIQNHPPDGRILEQLTKFYQEAISIEQHKYE